MVLRPMKVPIYYTPTEEDAEVEGARGRGGGEWGRRGGKGAAEEEKESTGDGCVCGECREVEILEVNVLVCVLYTTKIG